MDTIQNRKAAGCDENMIQNLKDAGCDVDMISDICRLYEAGELPDMIKILRRYRCHLMDDLHESQNRVDCLDYLVYQLEKGLKEKIIN